MITSTVILMAAAFSILAHVRGQPPPFDDAFITYRYVDNALSGKGLVYNPGERVLGVSTPLYLAWLLCLRSILPFSTVAVSVIGNAAWFILSGLAAFLLVRRLTGAMVPAGAATALLLVNKTLLPLSTGGMESFLFSGLWLLALYFIAGDRLEAAGVAAGFTALARPEGVLLVPLILAAAVAGVTDSERRTEHWRRTVVAVAAAVLPWLLWAGFAWMYYGDPLPHSIRAKARPVYPFPPGAALDRIEGRLVDWTWHSERVMV
ncbi:hypothetical protein JW905_09675, partial [bacterium]|nr:hypothetical protein [candidate division CSSED10-310 bacterium]